MHQITRRLKPGQDVRHEIERIVREKDVRAGVVLSLVGSLSKLTLRVADGRTVKEWDGSFEVVSATGTLSQADCHIHISASDQSGQVIGGHLKPGTIVATTVELVLLVFDETEYRRLPNPDTGYEELDVSN